MSDEILKRLDGIGHTLAFIAGKIGNAAPHIYKVLIRQAYIEGMQNVVLGVVFFVMFWYTKSLFERFYADGSEWRMQRPDGNCAALVFLALGMTTFASITVFCLVAAIGPLTNPEYTAITTLVHTLIAKQ